MNEIYLTTKQVTDNGEEVKIVLVSGDTVDEAKLNGRIKMAKAIENFKANSVNYAYADIRQLSNSAPLDSMEYIPTTTE